MAADVLAKGGPEASKVLTSVPLTLAPTSPKGGSTCACNKVIDYNGGSIFFIALTFIGDKRQRIVERSSSLGKVL